MKLNDFLNYAGSTTKIFKNIATDSEVEVLWDGFVNEEIFQRIVLIKLDNIPVMVAISSTNKTSPIFLDILQNSGVIPIGVRLFDTQSAITRSKMHFLEILVEDITNKIVKCELEQRLADNLVIERNSVFNYDNQMMELKEYILPGLVKLLDRALKLK